MHSGTTDRAGKCQKTIKKFEKTGIVHLGGIYILWICCYDEIVRNPEEACYGIY